MPIRSQRENINRAGEIGQTENNYVGSYFRPGFGLSPSCKRRWDTTVRLGRRHSRRTFILTEDQGKHDDGMSVLQLDHRTV